MRKKPRAPQKLSNRRVNIILKVLRQSLDRAVIKGWLSDNPARKIDLLREDKPEIDPLSVAEVKAFLSRGLQEEAIGLQWDDIDWQRKMLLVRRSVSRFGTGPTKTVESKRTVQMLAIVERALRGQRAASPVRSP